MEFLNPNINLKELAEQNKSTYQSASPFPNIYIDNVFNQQLLETLLNEFPDLSVKPDIAYNNYNEIKFATKGENRFGEKAKSFFHFLNSEPFLAFLQELSGLEEVLLPDPYFEGGGFHEIKKGGLLKIHADFNKHSKTKLDRRLNVLIYLNKNWDETYGGHFELWDTGMKHCEKKILPIFNRMAIFSTTSNSYHGHPNPLNCPEEFSRKSMALYYYSNGRPDSEKNKLMEHSTLFIGRDENEEENIRKAEKDKLTFRDFIPPLFVKIKRNILR